MLLKGGSIVNSDRKYLADILIENNIIKQIGHNIVPSADVKVIDVTNKIIIPGGIDPSTNFNLSSYNDVLQNESIATLAGGTTTIINRVQASNGSSLIDRVKALQTEIKSKLFCNYGFYAEINSNSEESIKSIETLAQNFGINSFQMTIDCEINSNILAIVKKCNELQCILRLQVEDKQYVNLIAEELLSKGISGPEGFLQSRCLENEIESLYKILKLIYAFPCGIIIPQVMNGEVASIIAQMKKQGVPIFSETITAALALGSNKYFSSNWDEAASVITDPPLRLNQDTAIIRSIHCGDIDMVASQHTTISNRDRSIGKRDFREIQQGTIGSEERMIILWDRGVRTGIINECEFVAATSTNAAKIFNLYPERGHIAVGSIADIVVWNPVKTRVISSASQHLKTDINIFEGISCQGSPEIVIINGSIKFQQNELLGNATGEKIDLKNNCKLLADKLVRYDTLRQFGKLSISRLYTDNDDAVSVVKDVRERNNVETNHQQSQDAKVNPLKMQRPLTSGGNRNMQDSSFSLSGSQIDDEKPIRSTIRTNHPPGGKSSLIF